MHSREFSEPEIISNLVVRMDKVHSSTAGCESKDSQPCLITFAHSFYFNNKQNASSNYCNDNRICNTNPMINSNRDTQSSDWSINKQTRKEI